MSRIARLLQQAAGAGGGLDPAEVFSADLWAGNGSTRSITNGIDLSTEGGLVWVKGRTSTFQHVLVDTERGANNTLASNTTGASSSFGSVTGFNTDGFDLGTDATVNQSANNFVGWSFRKAPKFFDVVTYTGDGVAGRTVSHNLGSVPGMIITKRTDSASDWLVYHRANTAQPETDYLRLNSINGTQDTNVVWNDTAPTDTEFTIGVTNDINANGGQYVAYLFAHDPSGIIQCGGYTGNGSTSGPSINLGWQPQFLMVKAASSAGDWVIMDSARSTFDAALYPNLTLAEQAQNFLDPTSTGFDIVSGDSRVNANTVEYVYATVKAA